MTQITNPPFRLNADSGGASGGSVASSNLVGADVSGSSQQASDSQGGSTNNTHTAAQGNWNWAREDGVFHEGWAERLPENIRGHASLKVIGSLPDLAKSYVETKAMIGKKLEAPGKNATPEQVAAWRKVVGAPDKADGYYAGTKTLKPDRIPEGMWDSASEKKFVDLAHKHHLSPTAVKEILGFYGDNVAEGLKTAQRNESTHLNHEAAALRAAWGRDFDANMHSAARVARIVGLDPKTHPIFTSAEVVQAFSKIGRLMSEDKLVTGGTGSINGSVSDRIRDLTDPGSNSILAREYRGEFGAQRQAEAQTQYHQLLQSTSHY